MARLTLRAHCDSLCINRSAFQGLSLSRIRFTTGMTADAVHEPSSWLVADGRGENARLFMLRVAWEMCSLALRCKVVEVGRLEWVWK